MDDLLPPWPLFSAFLLASLLLAVTPGPGVLYVVTRSLVHGRSSGLVSAAGVALGNLGHALAAALGLAALFAWSALAFTIVKYAGAVYLICLGVMMWRDRCGDAAAMTIHHASLPRVFRDGLMVALLNPKTVIFFAAFLPQFLTPAGAHPAWQASLLGTSFVAIAAITDCAYVYAAGALAPRVPRSEGVRRTGRLIGGATFVGLGIFAALADLRPRGG